jgi:hypothetical protein
MLHQPGREPASAEAKHNRPGQLYTKTERAGTGKKIALLDPISAGAGGSEGQNE